MVTDLLGLDFVLLRERPRRRHAFQRINAENASFECQSCDSFKNVLKNAQMWPSTTNR